VVKLPRRFYIGRVTNPENFDMNSNVPLGYSALQESEGYIALSGPYFWARDAVGGFIYGFRSDDRHGNPNGVLHGAAIVTFVDTILGHAVVAATGCQCATVTLDSQFVAAIPTGTWIEGRVRLRKLSKTLAFLDAEATSGETLLLAATATFRIFRSIDTSEVRKGDASATPG
jgi:acyl-coenzyme A thioesterase PaaI-like protein